jgi:hypothetical protein
MIKYIAIILSILTITLSALPCDDELVNADTESIVLNSDSHDDHHDSGDLCSPFCTCVCCANVVVEPVFDQELTVTDTHNTELNASYIFSFSRDFSNQVFQPPRV